MTQTTDCWRCGRQRYEYESCHHCGGSCKPLTKKKQKNGYTGKDTDWWLSQTDKCIRCGEAPIGLFDGLPFCQLHASTRNSSEASPP